MTTLWEREGLRVVLCEAFLDGRAWDARKEADLEEIRLRLGWTGALRYATQVHGTRILAPGEQGEADGFVILPGDAALVRHADCVPVAILDPKQRRAVLLHCGWRGCAGHLALLGVQRLLELGARCQDLQAILGPGIGPRDFEVGPDVLEQFPSDVHRTTSRGTASVDLHAFLRAELVDCGIVPKKILCDARSTFSEASLHSYRRDGAAAGRMAMLCLASPVQP